MRKLLNTLYICSNDLYLSLDNDNVIVKNTTGEVNRFPLHTLESIVSFSRKGISIPLISACSKHGIPIFLMTECGNLIAEISVPSQGNIMLRKEQYRIADQPDKAISLAKDILNGKIRNQKHVIDRFAWEHRMTDNLHIYSSSLNEIESQINETVDLSVLRGLEGEASAVYFSCFKSMIQDDSGDFCFHGRSRRPPLDRVNAMLSFGYTLLHNECIAALESVGLDASAGFLHEDHTGRKSLACDLMEELRAPIVDRFVLSMIHRQIIKADQFDIMEDGGVFLNREGKRSFIYHWQLNKKTTITHYVLNTSVPLGLIPYAQAVLLSKVIRRELKHYPPFSRR